MKTAISIPDNLFKRVEITAKKLGISRSRLFSRAVSDFLESHNSSEITEKLNSIYEQEPSSLDKTILNMQSLSLNKEDW